MLEFPCGRARCLVLDVGHFPMNADVLFASAPSLERAAALARHGVPDGEMAFHLQCLLVQLDGRRVLVDAPGLNRSGALPGALRAAGIDPGTIETVVLSHAHLDHYAACVDAAGGPAFPNATLVLQRREWHHWSAPANPEPDHARNFAGWLAPLRERLRLIDGSAPIVPGVDAMLTPGHSPGHMAVTIDGAAVFAGDVIQHAIQVEHPGWTAAFDVEAEQVASARLKLLEALARDRRLVVAPHLASPVGRIERAEGSFRWVPFVP